MCKNNDFLNTCKNIFKNTPVDFFLIRNVDYSIILLLISLLTNSMKNVSR